jgi:hypothetical protein
MEPLAIARTKMLAGAGAAGSRARYGAATSRLLSRPTTGGRNQVHIYTPRLGRNERSRCSLELAPLAIARVVVRQHQDSCEDQRQAAATRSIFIHRGWRETRGQDARWSWRCWQSRASWCGNTKILVKTSDRRPQPGRAGRRRNRVSILMELLYKESNPPPDRNSRSKFSKSSSCPLLVLFLSSSCVLFLCSLLVHHRDLSPLFRPFSVNTPTLPRW